MAPASVSSGTALQSLSRISFLNANKLNFASILSSEPNPRGNLNSNRTVNFSSSSSGSSWLEKWNDRNSRISPKQPRVAMNYRSRNGGSASSSGLGEVGGGGGSTMQRIVEKLKKFGYMSDDKERKGSAERVIEKGSVEDIFYVEEGMLPNTQGGFSTRIDERDGNGKVRFPWEERQKKGEEGEGGSKWSVTSKSKTSVAELTIPESELRRLRILTFQTKRKMRIGGGGVTQEVVDEIRDRWRTSEIVRLKIEAAAALNMRRMHEILEVSFSATFLSIRGGEDNTVVVGSI